MNVENTIENKETVARSETPDYDHLAVVLGKACPDDIRRTLAWAHEPDATFEIRTFGSQTNPWARVSAGYFRNVDVAVKAVLDHIDEFDPAQVYFTLNETTPDVYGRIKDRIEPRPAATTKDGEIRWLRNILIDLDPVRPQGIPSSEAELEASRKRMEDVRAWLSERGFPGPLVGMSGNGYPCFMPSTVSRRPRGMT